LRRPPSAIIFARLESLGLVDQLGGVGRRDDEPRVLPLGQLESLGVDGPEMLGAHNHRNRNVL
jgi:hypothetical protein